MESIVLSLNITCIGNLILMLLFSLFKRPRTIVNYFVAGLIGLPIFAMFFNLALYFNFINQYPIFFYESFPIEYLWAPTLYFYVHKMTGKSISFNPKYIIHFIPSAAAIVYSVYFANQTLEYKTTFFAQINGNPPLALKTMNIILNIQVFVYCILCIRKVNAFEKLILTLFSDVEQLSARWIKHFIYLYFGLNILAMIPEIIVPELFWFVTLLPVAMMISFVFMIYNNITHNQLYGLHVVAKLNKQNDINTVIIEPNALEVLELSVNEQTTEKATIAIEELEAISKTIKQIMETKQCFLDDSLTIKTLSKTVDIPTHKLSELLNQYWNMNFYDFVNGYRIDYAKKLIQNPDNDKYTIETIASMSGFRNRSTFYNAFTKIAGTTPKEFKNLR